MRPELQSPLAGPAAVATTPETVATEAESLRQELAGQRELYRSLAADFDHFKRRSRAEGEDRAAAQMESLMIELLPTLDNLERALASGASPGSPELHQGVAMTLQQLRQLLRQHGIETQESMGQPFDPHQHEAVSPRHDPAHPDHAIVEVFQRGYRRGERVLRPAKVAVNDLAHGHRSQPARVNSKAPSKPRGDGGGLADERQTRERVGT
jgi:molecular chaperone GrpE